MECVICGKINCEENPGCEAASSLLEDIYMDEYCCYTCGQEFDDCTCEE